MMVLPYCLSTLTGYLISLTLFRKGGGFSFSLQLLLAVGLGLGCSSLLTFFSFLICNEYNRVFIILFNLSFLVTLLTLNMGHIYRRSLDGIKTISLKSVLETGLSTKIFWLLFTGLSLVIYALAKEHPYGEWDAWALWNMKARFLITSGSLWKTLFTEFHWHTQPDYPLLLPFMNIWVYAFVEKNFNHIPVITGFIFTMATSGLLFVGLRRYIKPPFAALAACLILAHPFFIFMGTSQYSDIILAYYLLTACVLLIPSIRQLDYRYTLLLGTNFGLMCFAKNEGIMMTVIFLAVILFYTYRDREKLLQAKHRFTCALVLGLMVSFWATIIFKGWLSPLNRDVFVTGPLAHLTYFNFMGFRIVCEFIYIAVMEPLWHYLWVLIITMLVFGINKFETKESRIFLSFFVIYFMALLFVYLTTTNFDLAWRLSKTVQRVLFILLPAALHLVFYIHYREKAS